MRAKNYESVNAQYEHDSRYENTLDVVVQHMIAAGFSDEEIIKMLHVSKEFIDAVCTPTSN